MYRRYHQNDELFSNVLLTFVLFVMFGVLFYSVYQDTGGLTYSSYFYMFFTGVFFIISVINLVIFLLGTRRPVQDYYIDFENEVIKLPLRKAIPFQSIKLFARRENRSEFKVFYRTKILNIILFQLHNDEKKELSYEECGNIAKYAQPINHRQLYNYNFLILFLMFGSNLMYVVFQDSLPTLSSEFKYFIVFGVTMGVALLFIIGNTLRLNYLYRRISETRIEEI